ncbi:MAG TPA: lysophospholipid acyltransferase family protein [Gemmatimonadales bacterium]|nr:lysophospholipid acyltransferase family protein [Gemmatimonadales bacterium]
MGRIWQAAASLWAWLVLVLVIVVWLPLMALTWLVTAPFDPGRYAVGYLFRQLAVVMVALNPLWRFRHAGHAITDPRRPYVVVSNHESFVDILLLSHLPWEMKWLSKVELFRLPLLGWEMRLANDIPVNRGNRRSAIEALQQCRDRLEKKVSVMIFPEGTRSASGALLPFKDGAFRLAVDTGCPILPVALAGTRSALQKHSWRMGRSVAIARVLAPIETTGLGVKDVPALRERVRDVIAEARIALHRELGLPLPEAAAEAVSAPGDALGEESAT